MATRRQGVGNGLSKAALLVFACSLLFLPACKPVVNYFSFHPDKNYRVAGDALPAGVREVYFDAADGVRLQALLLANSASDMLTIYFHGNAGNIYHRIADLQRLRQSGVAVLGVSYRGYAGSEGSPSEPGIYLDAAAAFRYATATLGYPASRLVVMGRSIGSTAATDLAQDRVIAGLILVSPLSTAREQASEMGLGFAAGLAGNAFNNLEKVARVKAPLLVIHGTNDTLIPPGMGRAVFAAAAGAKQFAAIDGAGHNDLSSRYAGQYWTAIGSFLKKVSARP